MTHYPTYYPTQYQAQAQYQYQYPAHAGMAHGMPAAPALRHSGLGIASTIIGLVVALGDVALIVIGGILAAAAGPGETEDMLAMLVGLCVLASLLACVVGGALGIAGLVQSHRRRVFPALGLAANGLVIGGVVFLMVLGAMVGG